MQKVESNKANSSNGGKNKTSLTVVGKSYEKWLCVQEFDMLTNEINWAIYCKVNNNTSNLSILYSQS